MNPPSTKDCKNGEFASYQDAVWSYLLEHCDLTKDGALFVKFHTSDRATFEKRIRARWKYGYHRGDPVAKNETHLEKRFEHDIVLVNAPINNAGLVKRIRTLSSPHVITSGDC
jgi:hypothetical protein